MSVALAERAPETRRSGPFGVHRRSVGAVFLVSALLLLGLFGSWRAPGVSMDEGIVLEYPQLMLHGEVPFRDFQSSYGPGTYIPLAVAYQLLGPSVPVERGVGVAYRLAVILAIVALLWPLGATWATSGGSLATLAILPFGRPEAPVAYGWFLALACLLWGLWCARAAMVDQRSRIATALWVLSGLLAGAAASARPDLGVAALLSSAVLLWNARSIPRLAFTFGLGIGGSPLVWNLLAAGWSRFWSFGVLTRLHQLPVSGYPLPTGIDILVGLSVTTFVVVIAAVRERRQLGATAVTRCWLALATLSVLLLQQVFQRADSGHFAFVAPVTFGLLPFSVFRGTRSRLTTVAIPPLCAIAIGLSALVAASTTGFVVRNDNRAFAESSPGAAGAVERVLDWLDANVPPGRSLFVGPADLRWAFYTPTELYFLAPDLRPAGFYLELGPGDDTPLFTRRLTNDLSRADVLVLDKLSLPFWRRQIWPEARAGSAGPNAAVRRDFRAVVHVGTYSIWLRRMPGGARAPRQTAAVARAL